jgi:2-dehydropantoate 2-reductase
MGSITAACLRQAGHDVVIADGWPENVEAIRRSGIRIEGPDEEFTAHVRAVHLAELDTLAFKPHVVLLAVKSYDTDVTVTALVPHLAPHGFVVSVQNGINEDRIAAAAGRRRTVGCVVHMAGGMFSPGVVTRYSSRAWRTFTIGEIDGDHSVRVRELSAQLSAVGVTHLSRNIRGALWAKLALNAMSNGITGLTGLGPGRLWTEPEVARMMAHLGGEAVLVCEAVGCLMEAVEPTGAPRPLEPLLLKRAHLGDEAAMVEVIRVLAAAGSTRVGVNENISSLAQDLLKGRTTEIDYLNGHVASEGRRLGLATPFNSLVQGLVKEVERGKLKANAGNMEVLSRAATSISIGR